MYYMSMEHPAPLLRRLLDTSRPVEGLIEARLVELDAAHSTARLGVLHALADGALPLGDLAERLCCGRSNMTASIDRLERDGWVRRMADRADRRVTRAELTDAGRAAYREAVAAMASLEQELVERLGPTALRRVERGLNDLDRVLMGLHEKEHA